MGELDHGSNDKNVAVPDSDSSDGIISIPDYVRSQQDKGLPSGDSVHYCLCDYGTGDAGWSSVYYVSRYIGERVSNFIDIKSIGIENQQE
jgi:hypothetical protein